jgi:hypothetical protein
LVAAVLREDRMTHSHALKIVKYYTRRNYIAWKSHRKTRLGLLAKQRGLYQRKGANARYP